MDELKRRVLDGETISREVAVELYAKAPLNLLCTAANEIRRRFCGDRFDLCAIINGKSGRCSEDCKYCAQSAHYPAEVEAYPLLDPGTLLRRACSDARRGVGRFSVVTSGRALTDAELEEVLASYRKIRENCRIGLCASHGLLTYGQFVKLREAGVTRIHCNLETSRRNFPNVCTTHTYEEKIETLQNAKRAGLEICSGGIIGLGETPEDRIDLALELRELGVASVPVNVLSPIPGTPYERLSMLPSEEILRTFAVFRFLLPRAVLRFAASRGRLPDKGAAAFRAGANAAITGDMLTTCGVSVETDLELVRSIGYEAAV